MIQQATKGFACLGMGVVSLGSRRRCEVRARHLSCGKISVLGVGKRGRFGRFWRTARQHFDISKTGFSSLGRRDTCVSHLPHAAWRITVYSLRSASGMHAVTIANWLFPLRTSVIMQALRGIPYKNSPFSPILDRDNGLESASMSSAL